MKGIDHPPAARSDPRGRPHRARAPGRDRPAAHGEVHAQPAGLGLRPRAPQPAHLGLGRGAKGRRHHDHEPAAPGRGAGDGRGSGGRRRPYHLPDPARAAGHRSPRPGRRGAAQDLGPAAPRRDRGDHGVDQPRRAGGRPRGAERPPPVRGHRVRAARGLLLRRRGGREAGALLPEGARPRSSRPSPPPAARRTSPTGRTSGSTA